MSKSIIWGYARIVTRKQKIERQIDNIKNEYPQAIIIAEECTGTTTDRPKWKKPVEQIKKESAKDMEITLVFDEVSRMSRNAVEGFRDYKMLYDMGIRLVFLKERHINTDNFRQALQSKVAMTGTDADIILKAVNEYMTKLAERQIEIAFQTAEAEVKHLRQMTREGIKKAQVAGKQVGRAKGSTIETRKSIESKKKIQKYSRDFNGTLSDADCIKLIWIARNTYLKYKRELRAE